MKAENNKILKEKKNWILLLFKKLAKLIFNRIFYVAVAMLVQLGWILMMVLRLAAYSRYIDIGLRLIGIVLVSVITYFNPVGGGNGMDLSNPNILTFVYVFVCGAIAICAMILPGISGSTLLLIFGIYLPIVTAIKDILHFNFHALPIVIAFGLGVVTGVISIIKIIRKALDKHRAATVYLIIGLMLGSLYAIVMGPTTLDMPQPLLSIDTFSFVFFIIGGAVIMGMQTMKIVYAKSEQIDEKTTV